MLHVASSSKSCFFRSWPLIASSLFSVDTWMIEEVKRESSKGEVQVKVRRKKQEVKISQREAKVVKLEATLSESEKKTDKR